MIVRRVARERMCGRKRERTSGRGRIRVPAKLDFKGEKGERREKRQTINTCLVTPVVYRHVPVGRERRVRSVVFSE